MENTLQPKFFRGALLAQFIVAMVVGCAGCATGVPLPSEVANSRLSDVEAEAVGPPEIRVGDVWVDRILGGDKEFKVESVSDDGNFVVDEWGNGIVTDKNSNLLTYRSVTFADAPPTSWKKPLIWFKFPIAPGKTWAQSAHWETLAPDVTGTEEVRAKAVGWERVTVPAGTYKALSVEIRDRIIGTGGVYDLITLTYWYVSDVNRFVKYSYRSIYEGAVDAEMVSYKPAPREQAAAPQS